MQRDISIICMTERITFSVMFKKLLTFSRPVLFVLLFIFGILYSMEAMTAVPIIGNAENANWEIFTARRTINSVFPSPKEGYLWIGTEGGLEKRDVADERLLRLYTTLDGLNSNEITHLIGDCQSGVWVGTPAGISHILASGELVDLRFTHFSAVAMESSTFMAPDCRGGLWLSEEKGFKHLKADGTEENFDRSNSDLPSDVVNCLAGDGTGGLFIGTNAGVAWWQENGTWQIFNQFNAPLPENDIQALINDGAGGFWIVLADQIGHRKANGKWQFFDSATANLPDGQFLYADQEWITWIRGLDGTMYQSVNGQWQTFIMEETSDLSDNRVWALYPEETDKVLVWTGDGRLSRLGEQGHWETVQKLQQPSFYKSTRRVNQVVRGEKGRIWFGGDVGMGYFDPDGTWEVFLKDNSNLPDDIIDFLESDGNGGVWVGTNGGLTHIHADGTWEVFTKDNSDLPGNIASLELDGNGGVWVGTQRSGLAHLHADGTWEVFTKDNSDLPNDNYIEPLESDGNGGIWVETYGGLAHLHADGAWEVFTKDNSDLPSNIESLELDGNGGVWVETDYNGLAHLHADGALEVFTEDNSDLPSDYIGDTLSDGNGGIWVTGGGLTHIHADGTWEVFTEDNSDLPDNSIYELELDGDGGIWVGTRSSSLTHIHADGTWEVFTKDNSDLDLGLGDISSLESDGNGGIWVGGKGGVAHFHADGTLAFEFGGYDPIDSFQVNFLLPDGAEGYWLGTTEEFGHLTVGGHGRFDEYEVNGGGTAMLPDDSGGFYVASINPYGYGNLWYFTPEGERQENQLPYSTHPKVTALLYQNGLWVGTTSDSDRDLGLFYQAPDESWHQFTTENSRLPINEIHSIFSDGSGGIKVWTAKGHLAHLKSTWTWEIFDLITEKDIHSVMQDEAGGFWVGTAEGLEHVKSDLSVEDFSAGLPNQDVRSLAPDGRGGLYAGTLGGLAHLSFGNQSALIEQVESTDTPDTEETLSMLKGQRAAIIIAGGGNHSSNTLWDTTEFITNYIYKVLNKRGFLNEEIYYLSPKSWADFNGDGSNDHIVDAPQPERPLTVEDVREALQWAKTSGKLDQPLYIFFVDHGGTNRFQLSKLTYLEVLEFNDWIEDYQNTTGNEVVLVMDACYSGVLLEQLIAKDRLLISSTGDGLAYFDRTTKQGFSRFFAKGLLKGMNFHEAFEDARDKQNQLLGDIANLSAGSSPVSGNISQEPQFDDDGNNGQWLRRLCLNGCFATGDTTLEIEGLTTSTTLQAGQSLSLFATAVLAQGEITRVWAVLRPPKLNLVIDSNGTPILAFPRLILSPTEEKDTWETTWREAVYNGNYEITFYAEDNQGNIASSDNPLVISVIGGVDSPPEANVQIVLEKDSYHRGETFKAELIENLGWGYDLYAAVVLLDGNFLAFKNTNDFAAVNLAAKWERQRTQNSPLTLLDLTLPDNLPTGEYCLYGILSPERENVLETLNLNLWVWTLACFEII